MKTTRSERKRFIVNLCVLKDVFILPPFIILDRYTFPKTCILVSKLVVTTNESGWMNHETLRINIKSATIRPYS